MAAAVAREVVWRGAEARSLLAVPAAAVAAVGRLVAAAAVVGRAARTGAATAAMMVVEVAKRAAVAREVEVTVRIRAHAWPCRHP